MKNEMYSEREIGRLLTSELFENIEDETIHTPYREEKAILSCVKYGDLNRLKQTYEALPSIRYGKMSASVNPIRKYFYGAIANTTLVTRAAIEGGLDEETAFSLSDIYIKKMEQCTRIEELDALNEQMAIDFTKLVAKQRKRLSPRYSKAVTQVMKLIYERSHQKIRLEELAERVGLNAKYLSFLFKKETGCKLSDYILSVRMEEAKKLLTYSDYTSSQIGEYLAFNSQSYFISVFKRQTGLTPNQYRELTAHSPSEE